MKKLIVLLSSATVLLTLLFFILFWAPEPERLHPRLQWNIGSPLTVKKKGQWSLTVDSVRKQIVLKSADGITWFTTVPGKAFVGGSQDTTTAHEHRGSFHFTNNIEPPCELQTVDTVDEQKSYAEVGGLLFCDGVDHPWSLRFRLHTPQTVTLNLSLDPRLSRANLHFESHKEELFFGGGAQFTHFSLKGHAIPLWVSEQGIGRGLQPLTFLMNLLARSGGHSYSTYYSSGAFVSSEGRGMVIHSYPRTIVDFKNETHVTVDHWAPNLELSLSHAKSVKELLNVQAEHTGRMRPLPDWIHRGALLGAQGGQQVVLEKLKTVTDAGAKISGLWIQDWVGQRKTSIGKQLWWDWNLDTNQYPDWTTFRNTVNDQGIELLGYINPMLVEVPGNSSRRNLLNEAVEKDYLVETADRQPLVIDITSFSAHLLDITNPEARGWFLAKLKEQFLNLGFKGWMADFGEALPTNVRLQNQLGKDYHNQYAEDWIQLNRELIETSESPYDLVFFNRTGFTHTPKQSTLFWLGDQMVSWDKSDGLYSSLVALLSSGVSGATINHSDIGGYTSIDLPLLRFLRSEELMIRWMELNAFTAVFRSHEGNLPDKSLQVFSNEKMLRAFSFYSQIFARLFDYRKQVMEEAFDRGLPVVRPTWMEFPGQRESWKIDSQFFLGPDILVAPVLEPGVDDLEIWLPPGEWMHLFTQERLEAPENGQWVRVQAPLGQPAAFLKGTSKWTGRLQFQPTSFSR